MTVILRPPGSIYLSRIIRITDYIIMILISCLLRPCQRFLYLRTCRFGDAMVIGIGGDTRRDAYSRWSSGVRCNTYYYVIYIICRHRIKRVVVAQGKRTQIFKNIAAYLTPGATFQYSICASFGVDACV